MIFILLIGCVVFSSASGSHCPDGFVKFGPSCYHFSNDNLPWISAQVACNQALLPTKANLVEINDQAENNFLLKHSQATQKHYWVGASDWHITGVWRWIGSGKVVSAPVSYWAPGEPNGPNEHCMAINHGVGTSNCWWDLSCRDNLNFICETPA